MPRLIIDLVEDQTGDLHLRVNGEPIHVATYEANMDLTNDQIKKFCDVKSKQMFEDGSVGTLCINCDYNIGCRTGKRSEIGKPVNMYDPAEWECYADRDNAFIGIARVFRIIWYSGEFISYNDDDIGDGTGGASMNNDCFYDAIKSCYGRALPKQINTPKKLKAFLGLTRKSKVPIDSIASIEAVMNASISVFGDHIRVSSYAGSSTINLYLTKSHYYKHGTKKSMKQERGVSFTPIAIEHIWSYSLHNGDSINLYDGDNNIIVSIDKFKQMKKSFKYILLKSKAGKEQETRDEWLANQKILHSLCNEEGKSLGIDLFRYASIPVATLDSWKKFSSINEPEPIEAIEDGFLAGAFKAGIRYADISYEGPSWLYDINSMYPSMMIHRSANYPILAGKAITILGFEKYFKYGIYHAKVEGSHKLFTINVKNVYTHYDLTLAQKLGLTITLITNQGHNFYYYAKECLVSGREHFENYIKALYHNKRKGPVVKAMLNSLWGSLARRNHHNKYLNINVEADPTTVPNWRDMMEINFDFKENLFYCKYTKPEELTFATSYARIGVFLTSFARYQFANMVLQYTNAGADADAIVFINTDSILSNVPITSLPISAKLGEWKIEHEDINIKVLNKNKYIPV